MASGVLIVLLFTPSTAWGYVREIEGLFSWSATPKGDFSFFLWYNLVSWKLEEA